MASTKSAPLSEMLKKDAGKTMLQRINERHPNAPIWQVTVLAKGNIPETHTLRAESEGSAKSSAMLLYQQPLAGAEVSYEVVKLA